jgi:hypothetical protein
MISIDRSSIQLRGVLVAAALALTCAAAANASAPPVGALPAGPTSAIQTNRGELVAVALPHRTGGRVWRIARAFNPAVLKQVSEANVGANIVLVFRAVGSGTTTLMFGLTRGEQTTANQSRRFSIEVR